MTEPPPLRGPRTTLFPLLAYLRDPYGASVDAFSRWGDPYRANTAGGEVVFTGDPEGVRQIFAAEADTFVPFGVDLLGNVIGRSSLIVQGGASHRASRKLLQPSFHGARMRAYGALIAEITRAATAAWQPGKPFQVQAVTQSISLQVIIRAVFGVADPERMTHFREALVGVIDDLRPSFVVMGWTQSTWWPAWRRFVKSREMIFGLVANEIKERRALESTGAAPGEDILSLMLAARYDDGTAMSDQELIEQLMTVLVAGHETSAIALAWACHLVSLHPAVEQKLVAEVQATPDADVDALARLPYLEAVCNETLRLKPLTPSILRKLARPWTLKGHELPAGMGVAGSVIAVHRNPTIYPEPEKFLPERFVGRQYAPHEFLPFGGGVRRCIGAAFALYEMKIVLATILREWQLHAIEKRRIRIVQRNTVVGPENGIRMTAQPRR